MADYDYDLFVIGAGSGGVRASRIAAAHGAKVAVAEEYRVGGTCVIRGCVPKKLLVYGSHFAEELQDAAHYGWTVEGMTFDWPTLRDTVLRDVDRLNGAYTADAREQQGRAFPRTRDDHRPATRSSSATGARSPPSTSSSRSAPGRCCPSSRAASTASPRTRCSICPNCRGAS